ncbi:VOC family protein [Agromyces mediolanus]|uniref:VOC family protein n=1 Tax=Agromyces mediolanus TaxID=41986 RepID=UPI00204075A7|nr:VOC family protein [Agromyces mediolanus]MCM3657411.1 VOC family protein [Agromyces mediolanus]
MSINEQSATVRPATTAPLRGLSTVNVYADDVAAAQRWYTEFLGVEPYFFNPPQPAPPVYVEFRLGDFQHELGIVDRRFAPGPAPDAGAPAAQPITYWHVDDVEAVLARLLELGASPHQPIVERGPGFVTASVVDPFGNVLGIMFNRHFLDMVGGGAA